MTDSRKYRPRDGVAYRKIAGEMVLVDPRENILLRLNATATAIWESLEEGDVDRLTDRVVTEFQVERDTAYQDVAEFIASVLSRNLIVPR